VARATIAAGGRAYTVSFDDPRRRGDLYQSVVIAQLIDELTEEPVRGGVRVTTDLRGARPKAARDGVGGVAGVPSRLFPELDSQPYELDLRFEVDGFVPLVQSDLPVPQQPGFPDGFADVDLGLLALRRLPVVVSVRTMRLDGQNRPVPLPGATVEISGIWRRMEDLSGASAGADLISLRPPLSAARPQPGTTLEPVAMAPVAEPERRLARAAEPGARRLDVTRIGSVAIGSVVGIDRGDADRAEHIEVEDVVGPGDPESPAALVMAFPVRFRHGEGATVQEVTPGPLGPPTADLTVEGLRGDATVFVTSVAPFGGAPTVRISGGPAADEYVGASRYRVVTGAEAYGRLPPLTRVAAFEIVAAAPGPLAAPPTTFTPRYGVSENHVHLVLE
jgi:hypothetical protein